MRVGFLGVDFFGEDTGLTQEAWASTDLIDTAPPEETFNWGGFFDNTLNYTKQAVDIYSTYERSQLPNGSTVLQPRTTQAPMYTATAKAPTAISSILGSNTGKILLPLALGAGVYLLARK